MSLGLRYFSSLSSLLLVIATLAIALPSPISIFNH
jgi:hypothetical protein